MKICPQCSKTYEDFFESCLVDLTPLKSSNENSQANGLGGSLLVNNQSNSANPNLVNNQVNSANPNSVDNQPNYPDFNSGNPFNKNNSVGIDNSFNENSPKTSSRISPIKESLSSQAQAQKAAVKLSSANQSSLTNKKSDDMVGSVLDKRYEIVGVLGKGGMGVVYKGRQLQMERIVAIKVLYGHKVTNLESIKAFKEEAKSIAQIKHHHIITLLDFGMDEKGQPYLVMDYLPGIDLHSTIMQKGILNLEKAKNIFKQVINGLNFAHKIGIVHKDLKPENIMLTTRNNDPDWVTILDFGLSSLKPKAKPNFGKVSNIVAQAPMGSPPYMSPEQCLSEENLDNRSDIYSLGIVIFEALSGELPFSAKSPLELMNCHVSRPPTLLMNVNSTCEPYKALTNVLAKALEKDKENRYKNVIEFEEALDEAFERDSVNVKVEAQRKQAQTHNQEFANELKNISNNSFYSFDDIDEDNSQSETITKVYTTAENVVSENLIAKLKNSWFKIFSKDNWSFINISSVSLPNLKKKLTQCAFCGTPAQAGLRFCMSCQRELISAEELLKLRRSQGDFSLKSIASSQLDKGKNQVQFSRAKNVGSLSDGSLIKVLIYFLITIGVIGGGYYYMNTVKHDEQNLKQHLTAKKKTGKYSKYSKYRKNKKIKKQVNSRIK